MGVEKSELKAAMLGQLEREVRERWEALGIELYRIEGGLSALETLKTSIERDVYARFKRDIDEGKIDKEVVAPQVHRYLQTCVHFTQHLHKQLADQRPIQEGRIDEANNHAEILRKKREAEESKAAAVKQALQDGAVVEGADGAPEAVPSEAKGPARRPLGVRPAAPLKARRTGAAPIPAPAAEGQQEPASGEQEDVDARALVPPVKEEAPPESGEQEAEGAVKAKGRTPRKRAAKRVAKKGPRKAARKVAGKDGQNTG